MMQMLSIKNFVIIGDLLHQAANAHASYEKRLESQALQEPKIDERKVENDIWITLVDRAFENSEWVLSNGI